MSKKRVHEIAKELKSQGVELDNKEVVAELQGLGYDVKSHSSSVEDDQATAAIGKILAKRKPEAATPAVAAKGFVVRRRAAPRPAVTQAQPPAAPRPAEAQVAASPPAARPDAERPGYMATAVVTRPPASKAPAPAPSSPAPQAAAPAQPAASTPPQAVVPPPATPTSQASQPAAAPAPDVQAPVAQAPSSTAQPAASQPQGSTTPASPAAGEATTQPPMAASPSAGAPAPAAPEAKEPPKPEEPKVDPRTLRPTATQAVVISRPTVAVRRVTPTSASHRSIPLAPGKKAIGEVREFKVVSDRLGRGRELVDVSKKKTGARKPPGTDGRFSKQEMTQLAWGRAIPIRGKKKRPTKKGQKTQITEMSESKKVLRLQEGITVADLSQKLGIKSGLLIKKLMKGGTMVTANQLLDVDTAELLASDYGWRIEKIGFEVEDHLPDFEEGEGDRKARPPVVTVMGHVDHGKTSLLDAIRQADVASGEAGGITQHMGAYTVQTSRGEITFLDTPGHEAFSEMRARGADVTDVVILVVAADDGVMPQTEEAIKHARAAEVPIVVAINKIDVPGANQDRVKQELANRDLVPEDWGGDIIMVPVSAKEKTGIDTLLENVILQSEMLELGANPDRPAVGRVIEAKMEKGRGPVATVLVQEGTLRVGDALVAGPFFGKIRLLLDDRGNTVDEVPPGHSAEVIGLSGVPQAGEQINAMGDEKAAKEIAGHRAIKGREAELTKVTGKDSLEALLAKAKAQQGKTLRVVLRADVQGSVEAVANAIQRLSNPKVKTEIVQKGVGALTESDVMLAGASGAILVGFNVKIESNAQTTAKAQGVELQTYSIIYELQDGIRSSMEDLLDPIRTEKTLGRAEVRDTFNVPKLGTIAGVSVLDGIMRRSAQVRLLRGSKKLHTGKMASLKRFKDDVREVSQGYECGIGIENYTDLQPGDIIEAFEIEETRPKL